MGPAKRLPGNREGAQRLRESPGLPGLFRLQGAQVRGHEPRGALRDTRRFRGKHRAGQLARPRGPRSRAAEARPSSPGTRASAWAARSCARPIPTSPSSLPWSAGPRASAASASASAGPCCASTSSSGRASTRTASATRPFPPSATGAHGCRPASTSPPRGGPSRSARGCGPSRLSSTRAATPRTSPTSRGTRPASPRSIPPTSMAYAETQSMFCESVLGDAGLAHALRQDAPTARPCRASSSRPGSRRSQPFRAFGERMILVVPYFERELYALGDAELEARSRPGDGARDRAADPRRREPPAPPCHPPPARPGVGGELPRLPPGRHGRLSDPGLVPRRLRLHRGQPRGRQTPRREVLGAWQFAASLEACAARPNRRRLLRPAPSPRPATPRPRRPGPPPRSPSPRPRARRIRATIRPSLDADIAIVHGSRPSPTTRPPRPRCAPTSPPG